MGRRLFTWSRAIYQWLPLRNMTPPCLPHPTPHHHQPLAYCGSSGRIGTLWVCPSSPASRMACSRVQSSIISWAGSHCCFEFMSTDSTIQDPSSHPPAPACFHLIPKMFPDSWGRWNRLTSPCYAPTGDQMATHCLLCQTLAIIYFLSRHIFVFSFLCFSLWCLDKPISTGPFLTSHHCPCTMNYRIISIRMTWVEKNLKSLINLNFWLLF